MEARPVKGEPVTAVRSLFEARYERARFAFLAGSVMRGDHTATSDLDVVVVFERLPNAYRESFMWADWPVETFVHDPETLRYFCEEECWRDGVPSLLAMISEGHVIPEAGSQSEELKAYADRLLAAGPKPWGETEIDRSRYFITDVIEDVRAPRSRGELHAAASALYPLLADHYLRSRRLWSARGKSVPRRLHAVEPTFAVAFERAFLDVFEDGSIDRVAALAEEILRPNGGWLFAGYSSQAPTDWRISSRP